MGCRTEKDKGKIKNNALNEDSEQTEIGKLNLPGFFSLLCKSWSQHLTSLLERASSDWCLFQLISEYFCHSKNKSLLLLHTSVQTNAELCCKKWCYNSDLMSKYKSRAKHVKRTILGNGNHMVETAHDLYDLPRIFLLRPSVIHHQTRHAGWCCRQLNTLYGISRLFHICHMLNVNLLSAVKRIRVPMVGLPILVFSDKCQWNCIVLGCEHRSHYRMMGPHSTLMEPVFDSLFRNMLTSSLLEVILESFGSTPPEHKADISPAAGLLSFYSLLQLCWETHQTSLWQHIWMCHPGGAGLPVQPDWVVGTASYTARRI